MEFKNKIKKANHILRSPSAMYEKLSSDNEKEETIKI